MHRDFSQLKDRNVDVLVCGGGVYGAWTAYDAALRGLKVAIVDQGDWACATSSASSKLIHGGLRYLESLDFKLVRKTLAERQMLLKTAPHRVWPLCFGIPVYKHSRIGSLQLKIGLLLYDLLAGTVPKTQTYQYHSHAEFAERFPCLETTDLAAGFTYFDAQTDDARYVLELIAGAQNSGAICLNYCRVNRFLENDGRLCGAVCQDQTTGETADVGAARIVNTAGQWSARLHDNNRYRLSKGVHLVLPKMLENEALLLTAQTDGRVFFIMPWYGMTLLGTTDTDYNGDIEHVTVEAEDIRYLLSEANRVLRTANWTENDIIGRYAGLRVLKPSDEPSPSAVSRDWTLKIAPDGLLSSIGGKLTSAREDAEHIVDAVCEQLGIGTAGQTFGKPFPWRPDTDYAEWCADASRKATYLGIDSLSAHWLQRRHGNRAPAVFELCEQEPELARRITPALPFIMADLVFCAQHEMVVHLEDLLRRRLPLLILAKPTPAELLRLACITAEVLGWDRDTMHHQLDTCTEKWLLH
ncbi:glycerol-3-phosphate dehydrogenase/oxidase [Methylobacter sp.]|uniref:glycerol-3-phosphate dehydrogenase/oxidase n=1 Tax=Methylobacter sp. TaxID=2051955 RepID=UPI003DA260D2